MNVFIINLKAIDHRLRLTSHTIYSFPQQRTRRNHRPRATYIYAMNFISFSENGQQTRIADWAAADVNGFFFPFAFRNGLLGTEPWSRPKAHIQFRRSSLAHTHTHAARRSIATHKSNTSAEHMMCVLGFSKRGKCIVL